MTRLVNRGQFAFHCAADLIQPVFRDPHEFVEGENKLSSNRETETTHVGKGQTLEEVNVPRRKNRKKPEKFGNTKFPGSEASRSG